MVRTRVGYAGGSSESPTYKDIGDHSETIQIDYDPSKITFDDLLDVYWDSHSPYSPSFSIQYASKIMYHNDQQREAAEESIRRREAEIGRKIHTQVVAFERFYLAEEYHQKHNLRDEDGLMAELRAIYPRATDFLNSTAVARVNGYVGGWGSAAEVQEILPDLGLSGEAGARLLNRLGR